MRVQVGVFPTRVGMLLVLRLKVRPLSLTIEEIVDGFFNEFPPQARG